MDSMLKLLKFVKIFLEISFAYPISIQVTSKL